MAGLPSAVKGLSRGVKALEMVSKTKKVTKESSGINALRRVTNKPVTVGDKDFPFIDPNDIPYFKTQRQESGRVNMTEYEKLLQRMRDNTLWGTKTSMPFTDDQLSKTQAGMNPRNITEIVEMDVNKLIDEHARILSEATGDSKEDIIQSRLDDTEVMNELRNVFINEGNMNIPALWKPGAVGETEGQEGLHRALVAKQLGIKKVPVAVVQKAQREELERLPLPEVVEE